LIVENDAEQMVQLGNRGGGAHLQAFAGALLRAGTVVPV
jgi:hypothetical protein